jgi:Domain of unknown function (DUF1841)
MPFFANQNRDQLRQMYFDAWHKHCNQLPMQPLQAQVADVIALHPEYHKLFKDRDAMQRDWTPEGGVTNPFLHLGSHLAIREQIATDRPAGIRSVHQALSHKFGSVHDAEHQMIETLMQALWSAQRSGVAPDEQAYLEALRRLI